MEIYLKELANPSSQFQFPSLPEDDIDFKRVTAYREYDIIGKGKRVYPSGMGEQAIRWKAYFWGKARKNVTLLNRSWKAPKDCVSQLVKWQKNKTPLNLIVSGGGINEDVTIASFEYRAVGAYGDILYDISFNLYYDLKIYTTKELGTKKEGKKKKKTERTDKKTKSKTYKIVSGDTLDKIALKFYGKSSKWSSIYSANAGTIESAAKKHGRKTSDNGHWIYPGTVLTIP